MMCLQDMKEAAASGGNEEEAATGREDEKAELKAVDSGKGGIWGRFRKKKRPTNEDDSASNSPTIKAGHSKAEKQGKSFSQDKI